MKQKESCSIFGILFYQSEGLEIISIITLQNGNPIEETFEEFILSRRAKELLDKTIQSYVCHFKAV